MEPTEVRVEEDAEGLQVYDPQLFHDEEDEDLCEEYELGELPEEQADAVDQEY